MLVWILGALLSLVAAGALVLLVLLVHIRIARRRAVRPQPPVVETAAQRRLRWQLEAAAGLDPDVTQPLPRGKDV